jgi:cysteine synthase A
LRNRSSQSAECWLVRTAMKPLTPTFLCDAGERYHSTIFDDDWLAAQGFETAALEDDIHGFLETGRTLRDRARPKRPA